MHARVTLEPTPDLGGRVSSGVLQHDVQRPAGVRALAAAVALCPSSTCVRGFSYLTCTLSTAAKNSGRERNGSATIGRLATNLHSPRTPRMPRLAVQLSILAVNSRARTPR